MGVGASHLPPNQCLIGENGPDDCSVEPKNDTWLQPPRFPNIFLHMKRACRAFSPSFYCKRV